MRSLLLRISLTSVAVLASASLPTAQSPAWPYDHVHLLVPDTAAGANWYEKMLGGVRPRRRLGRGDFLVPIGPGRGQRD